MIAMTDLVPLFKCTQGKTEPSAAGMAERIAAPFSFARRMQDIDLDMG